MSYKPAAFRFQQQSDLPAGEFRYRPQVNQLQEIFPDFSVEGTSSSSLPTARAHLPSSDLQSLLLEVGGDVELAGQRISDGLSFPPFFSFSPLSIICYHRSCRTVGLRENQKRQKTTYSLPPTLKGPSLSRS